jgi:hypothetical protein
MSDEFSIKKARKGRDEGIERVGGHNPVWLGRYYDFVKTKIPAGVIFTAEHVRRRAAPIIGEPNHSSAWGAAANGAFRRGFFSKTGNMRTPKAKKSHARAIQEYRKL